MTNKDLTAAIPNAIKALQVFFGSETIFEEDMDRLQEALTQLQAVMDAVPDLDENLEEFANMKAVYLSGQLFQTITKENDDG